MSYVHLNSDKPFPIVRDRTSFELGTYDAVRGLRRGGRARSARRIKKTLNYVFRCMKPKQEIRFINRDNGTVVCCYMVSMEATFNNSFARECRGIVFGANGSIVSRPLHKFFNVNEKATTQIGVLPWEDVVRVMDKRDGSMIHTVNVGREFCPFDSYRADYTFDVKSKMSFSSDVANSARDFILERDNYLDFCQSITQLKCTAIFEWTSPIARIVLPYKEDELKLLHVRNNDTGEYWMLSQLVEVATLFNIQMCDTIDLDGDNYVMTTKGKPVKYTLTKDRPLIDQFLELAETLEDTEGWIFQFKNGDMVKLKTKDYMKKHRAMTFLRERDIAEMVIDETVDDLKAMLVGEGVNISDIINVENDVVMFIENMVKTVEATFSIVQAEKLSKKEAALKFGPVGANFEYFTQLMKRMDGKEPDYKDHFKKRVLQDRYSLRQLNLLQSTAEVE